MEVRALDRKQKPRLLTKNGLEKIETKLDYLKFVKRKEIAERIKVARGFGDLSENAEYDEARNAQAENEMEIEKLESILANAELVDESAIPKDSIYLGSKVKLYDFDFDEEVEYEIVGTGEADPFENKVSNESPMGEGLLNKKVGDVVEISIPAGISKFKVLEIRR